LSKLGKEVDGTPLAIAIPSVMLVAVTDATASASQKCLPAMHVRAASVEEARARIAIHQPLVVVVGAGVPPQDIAALRELAIATRGVVVSVESCLLPGDVEARLTKAWRAAGAMRAPR
jgi:hypothetical protein